MVKVGICDNDKEFCNFLELIIEQAFSKFSEKVEIYFFYSGKKLIEYDQLYTFNFIFLKPELEDINGIELGKTIRNNYYNGIEIVYISEKEYYCKDLFDIRPLYYFVKPINLEMVENLIQKYFNLNNRDLFFKFNANHVSHKVLLKDILYFESKRKKVNIILPNNTYSFYGRLSEVKNSLNDNFISIHKSYLINYSYVKEYKSGLIKLKNNIVLPVSQQNRKQVRNLLGKNYIKQIKLY
jgi:DNA-binding LytR/AlgR family response regulator